MSPAPREEGGIPRARGSIVIPPGGSAITEEWRGANDAKAEKLRRNDLQRRARARGLELRHSAHGYSLLDTGRKLMGDRSDLTLDDVESLLKSG